MDSPNEKLALGLQRLAKAGSDPDLLGLALQSIHGALEDAFRRQLAGDPQVPEAQRATMLDPKLVQWKALLDAMTLHRDLSPADAEAIGRWNSTRNRVAHGGRFSGTRAELEAYATLAQRLTGYTPAAKLPPAPLPSAPPSVPNQAPRARARPASPPPERAPEIPRAVRVGAATPARSGPSWLVIGAVVALLSMLALLALVRGFTSAPASAELPPAAATLPPPPPAPGLAATPAMPATPRTATVQAVPDLNVRARPSLDAAVLFSAASGTRLAIIGGPVEADGHRWWQVELQGHQGWCAGEFLQLEE